MDIFNQKIGKGVIFFVLLYRTAAQGGTAFGSFRLRGWAGIKELLRPFDLPIQSLLSF